MQAPEVLGGRYELRGVLVAPPTSILPPSPPSTPVLVEEPPPLKKRGENGNGNCHKKGGRGGD